MELFKILVDGNLVGKSNLERGDPPMGVAFGKFYPTEGYEKIRNECIENHADQTHLCLSLATASGKPIPCIGVAIFDYTSTQGAGEIQVEALGIGYPLYQELFPRHVAEYEKP